MPSDAELREDLVGACREMARLGLAVATTGNASVRAGERVLISPTSLAYEDMVVEDVVEIDLSGRVLGGRRTPSSEWRLHCAIYARRGELGALVHTHSPHAVAWSFLGEELATGSEELEHYAGGAVRTAPFAPTGGHEIARGAVEALGERRALLLARHGAVAAGGTLREALAGATVVEQQAQIAWLLRSRS